MRVRCNASLRLPASDSRVGVPMKVVCFVGYSGSGKTRLLERLIPELKQRGLRVSVIKHAHHQFEIDHPGKDSFRHREAGAFEVVVASSRRLALIREFEREEPHSVHQLVAELDTGVDWVLVEGFKQGDLNKVEIWRSSVNKPSQYFDDELIIAVATDSPAEMPKNTPRPVLDLNNVEALADWLLENQLCFEYDPDQHRTVHPSVVG